MYRDVAASATTKKHQKTNTRCDYHNDGSFSSNVVMVSVRPRACVCLFLRLNPSYIAVGFTIAVKYNFDVFRFRSEILLFLSSLLL